MERFKRFSELEVNFLLDLKKLTIGNCNKCEDGWSKAKACECRKVFMYLKELVYAKIPQEYWNIEWDKIDITPKTVKTLISKYIDNFEIAKKKGKGVCFTGTNGIGKTTLLCEIGKVSIQLGFKTLYTTAQSYIDYKMAGNTPMLERIEENTEVLLLDEMDKPYKKKGSDYVPAKVEELFRKLLPRNVIVCVASNFHEKEIEEVFGDSVFSIMKRKIKFITILGEDLSDCLQDDWEESLMEDESSYLSDYYINMSSNFGKDYE